MTKYNEKIHKLLSGLYQLRVLNYKQIKQFAFPDCSDLYCQKVLRTAINDYHAVEKSGFFFDDSFYTITKAGITLLKNWGIVSFDSDGEVVFPDHMLSVSAVKLHESKTAHQIALNQFVLDFFALGIKAKYYDEIYVSSVFKNIRPDGVLLVGNTCYFLEMDMATERKQRLLQKWESYRYFLTSGEQEELGYNIRVLFIIESTDITVRTKNLQEYILDNLVDFISPRFNLFIGKKDPLLSLIKSKDSDIKSLLSKKGFEVLPGRFSGDTFSSYSYGRYCYKKDKSGGIETIKGTPVEFIFDDASNGITNLLIQKNILSYPGFSASFHKEQGRPISYVIAVPSIEDAYRMQEARDTFDYDILFVTKERLNTLPFFEAIFGVDRHGNIWHFLSDNPKIRVDEGKISSIDK